MVMVKRFYPAFLVLCIGTLLFANTQAQYQKAQEIFKDRGEVYFKFNVYSPMDVKRLDLFNIVSFDRIVFDAARACDVVYAYANKEEFEKFSQCVSNYEVLTPPCFETKVEMSDSYDNPATGSRFDFNKYPTFSAYVNQMKYWAQTYPQLCDLDTLGFTANNKHVLLSLRVTKDLAKTNGRAKYLLTSTIHGDETVTYMMELHTIDTLLSSYGKDQRLTKLLDNVDMYFCPLLNPDATYFGGDNSVQSAQRNSVTDKFDLNRNNPCFCGTTNHDKYGLYTKTALETKAMQVLHNKYYFNFISDDHGGIAAIFWPYACVPKDCPDLDWSKWVCKRFADQVHKDCNNNGYFTSAGGDGIGHWYTEMYQAHGTRVDFQSYYGRGKAFGPETSVQKILAESELDSRWRHLKEAYFQYMELLYTGVQGFVTDSITKQPIYKVKMGHNEDFDNSEVFTDSLGFYLRFSKKGTFTLSFSATGYKTKTFANFAITDYTKKYPLDVELCPLNVNTTTQSSNPLKDAITVIPQRNGIRITAGALRQNAEVGIYAISGKLVRTLRVDKSAQAIWDGTSNMGETVQNGCYAVKIRNNNATISRSFILNR